MAAASSGGKADIGKLVEKQMRNWELAHAQRPALPVAPPPVEDFVSVSRMVGAGGRELASALGQRLGWPVFDREILQVMAGDDAIRARLYERLDERDLGWLEDTLRWLLEGEFRKEDYFHRLTETVLALARGGHAVFLGRGADLMLPRDRGLRVGLVAPLEYCARRFARLNSISEALARAEVERIQHERSEFLRNHFGKSALAPTRHDVMFNMAHFTVPEVVELICSTLRGRGVMA